MFSQLLCPQAKQFSVIILSLNVIFGLNGFIPANTYIRKQRMKILFYMDHLTH